MVSSGRSWQINWRYSVFMLTLYFLECLLVGLGLLVGVIYSAELQRLLTKLCTVFLVDTGFGGPAWSICLTKGQKSLSFLLCHCFLFRLGSVELLIKMNDRDCPKNRKIELPALWWQNTRCPLLLFLMEVKADIIGHLTNLVYIPAFLVGLGLLKWPTLTCPLWWDKSLTWIPRTSWL